jgi:hypothetical protein
VTPPELRALLADSLVVWQVEGARIALAGDGVAVTAPDGTVLRIIPAAAGDAPLRWWLERPGQRRPHTGMTGLLRGLRNALGAGDGLPSRLRMAPP